MSKANSPAVAAFFEAILHHQVEQVCEMAKANPELLDARDYRCFGATPITCLAFGGNNREMIQLLLDLGADVNAKSDWEMGPWSPLHCAIHSGNDSLAKWLLENGATLDVHTAAALGMTDQLQKMLDEDPDLIHQRGGDGCLPLHFAGTIEAAKLLLDRGADLNARCVDHFSTPVQYLAHVRPKVARYLFSVGAEADIFTAVLADDATTVKSILERDPFQANQRLTKDFCPKSPDHDVHNMLHFIVGTQCTPLHAAAKANRPAMVRLLNEHGADLNARGGYDDSAPLHVAAWDNQTAAAEALVKCGANIDLKSGRIHNNTPTGWAIVAGSSQVVDTLLSLGAQIFPWFIQDAEAGQSGEFLKYKSVPLSNYAEIIERLNR